MYIQEIQTKIYNHQVSWDKIYNQIVEDDAGKVDIETDTIQMDDDGTFVIDDRADYKILPEAETYVLSKLVPSGVSYLKRCPSKLKAYNINYWLQQNQGKQYFIRTKVTAKGRFVRAVLSDKYTKLDNQPIFEEIYNQFNAQYVPVSLDITDISFHLRLAHKDGVDIGYNAKGDIVHGGCHIANSETGTGSVKLMVIVYRLKCSNGLVSPEELANQSHIHLGNNRNLELFFRQAVMGAKYGANALIEMLKNSHQDTFDPLKANTLVEYIGKRYNWQEPFIEQVNDHLLEEDKTKFGLIQAVTETAKLSRADDRLRYERQAGQLLKLSVGQMAEYAYQESQMN